SQGTNAQTADQPAFRTIHSLGELQQALHAAKSDHRPVMLDFYADWCVSCKEMERFTYTQPRVQKALRHFVLLKADVTANNADERALLKHFGLFGPPATIFYNTQGKPLTGLQLVG